MGLNLAKSFRRSNLTKQQRKEAVAAIFGIDLTNQEQMMSQTFGISQVSPEDVERMRQIVNQADAMQQAFDINKPPSKQYRFQEFPKLMYRLDKNGVQEHRPANSKEEQEAAEAAGWSTTPVTAQADVEPELDDEAMREYAAKEKQLAEARIAEARKKKASKDAVSA